MDEPEVPSIAESAQKIYKPKREDRIAIILAMKAAGKSYDEIAAHVHSTRNAIWQVIKRVRQRSRENLDPQALLDGTCKVKAVRNLERILDDKGHAANWSATRDTLYGTGMLKRHVNTKTEGSNVPQLPALTVNVVTVPTRAEETRALPDIVVNAVGTPREL